MGLFNFLKRDNSNSEDIALKERSKLEFTSRTIESTNVEKDLKKIADKFNVNEKDLDFTIISYKTFYRLDKDSKYKAINELNKDEILTEKNILDSNFEIRQKYKINVFLKKNQASFPLRVVLGTNKDFTKVSAIFKSSKSVSYHERLDSEILHQINNKKLRQGIFIGLFDEKLKEAIKKVTSHIMINKELKEDIKIDVCEGYHRVVESGEYVNLVYKEKKYENDKGVSLRDRSNLFTVKDGELVIEVIKPRVGKDGRNCKGEFLPKISMKPDESELKYEDLFFGEEFKIVELDDKIEIYAKKDGYIIQNGRSFSLSDDIVVEQINLKTTGSIDAKDSDITVNVQNSDESMDAIASGVVLNTKEVNVKGNVANNAKIEAKIVNIDGQTHKSSYIKADKVKIHLHKGFVEGEKIDIDTLEGGVVVADQVFVNTVSGGEIKAKKIFINRIISNSTIIASEVIELNELDGNGNKFIMDPRAQRGYETKIVELEKLLSECEYKINKKSKELRVVKNKIISEQDSIEEVKKIVLDMKSKGKKPPLAMINKIKDDKQKKIKFNEIVKEIKNLKLVKEEFEQKIKNFNNVSLDSKVVINTPWKEYNEVIFRIVEPKREIKRAMNENEVANSLGLKVTKDNDYIIANLD